jgi:hypothetical protein
MPVTPGNGVLPGGTAGALEKSACAIAIGPGLEVHLLGLAHGDYQLTVAIGANRDPLESASTPRSSVVSPVHWTVPGKVVPSRFKAGVHSGPRFSVMPTFSTFRSQGRVQRRLPRDQSAHRPPARRPARRQHNQHNQRRQTLGQRPPHPRHPRRRGRVSDKTPGGIGS